jgi:hypothetical protein
LDRHPVRQDHLPQPGRDRSAGELELTGDSPPSSLTFPLLLWLGLQLATVALVASRFPLWANSPRTSESLTLAALLAVQILASSLLFPILLRDWRSAAAVIAACWPFALVAAALSSTSTASAAMGEGYVSLWLAGLAGWRPLLRSDRMRAAASAVAVCLAAGGPVYVYLLADYSPASTEGHGWWEVPLFPLLASISLLQSANRMAANWLLPSLILFTAGLTTLGRRLRSSKAA